MIRKLLVLAVSLLVFHLSGCRHGDLTCSSMKRADMRAYTGFEPVAHFAVPEGIAEIVTSTPDGRSLIYTNAETGQIGIINIADLANPKQVAVVDVTQGGVGEPTSAAITPDGRYVLVAVRMGDDAAHPNSGIIRVYDIHNLFNVIHVADIPVGVGPDSIAIASTPMGNSTQLQVVVAVENEETDKDGDATLNGRRPGRIDTIKFNTSNPGLSTVTSIDLVTALKDVAGANFTSDPQPEYVAVHPNGKKACITLQENNAVAVLDIGDPDVPRLEKIFDMGNVRRVRSADIHKDKEILLKDSFDARREADGIAYLPGGDYIATANEGDTSVKTFGDGVFSGGRSFTIFDESGQVIFDSGAAIELQAVIHGQYPDKRSAKRGIEVEGIAAARFGSSDFVFAASERGSFVSVYNVTDPKNPRFLQFLPTGRGPEGVLAITRRDDGKQLLVTANEKDGTINIFKAINTRYKAPSTEPILESTSMHMPWGALSGLTTDGTYFYAVPDSAFGESRIFRINMEDVANGCALIDRVTYITNQTGSRLKLDPEGIVFTGSGFWVASEGKKVEANQLLLVNLFGKVQKKVSLPAWLTARYGEPGKYGFEGVAMSNNGQFVYAAMQRGFDPADEYARILRYDTQTDEWITFRYPLDMNSADPDKYWTGISDIVLLDDQTMLVLERDKGEGVSAQIKRIYKVSLSGLTENAVLTKVLVRDLHKDFNYLQEKAEGIALFKGDIWVVNDNDSRGWTRLINAGKP